MFQLDRVLIVIEHVWISNLLCCVTWKLRPKKAVTYFKKMSITLVFANWTVLALQETFLSMFRSCRATIFGFKAKLSDRCFCYFTAAMFVSLRRTQTWRLHKKLYKMGDTLLQIGRTWKTAETWFLAKMFMYQSSIVSQILDFVGYAF